MVEALSGVGLTNLPITPPYRTLDSSSRTGPTERSKRFRQPFTMTHPKDVHP